MKDLLTAGGQEDAMETRGSSHVSLARPRAGQQSCYRFGRALAQGFKRARVGKKTMCLNISSALKSLKKIAIRGKKPLMINEFTNLLLAAAVSICANITKSTAIRVSPSVGWLSSASRDQGHVIELLTFKLKRELLSHTD